MEKVRVLLGIRDRNFSEKIKALSGDVEIVGESASLEAIKGNSKRIDLLFLDRMPLMGFSNSKIKVVIAASRYSRKKEFLSVISGAKGFITKDISEPYLLKAIKVISAGEIWVTRLAVAKVFEEYCRMAKGDGKRRILS